MNLDFTKQEQEFIARVNGIFADYALEAGKRVEGYLPLILEKLAATDYLRLGLEKVEGLSGLVPLTAAMEGFAAAYPSLFLSVELSTRVFGRAVARFGTGDQKARILSPLLSGKLVGALALSEAAMNVENEPLQTKAVKDGDSFVVSGYKGFVVNGPVADVTAVAAAVEGGLSLFFIPKGTPGLTLGEPLSTLGFEGAAICAVSLDNCRVPADAATAPVEPKSLLSALRVLENQVLAAAALGAMRASYEAARKHAKEHKSGGKPVIAFQEVGFKLAEMLTLLQTSELLAYRSAWTFEQNDKQAEDLSLCAKVFCAESAERVASSALQILSKTGFVTPNPAERAYRNAKLTQIAGTSSEIARMKIGDSELGYR
ncbi:MAG: acyl-CoA dehydrogenase family protein [Thermodesulfobacteriota bacterium]